MKHRVADLEGTLLDAAVAMAEGLEYSREQHWDRDAVTLRDGTDFAPSTDWEDGGEIIQREKISTIGPAGGLHEWQAHCRYSMDFAPERLATQYGPTPLISACRAYVASRFGDEVELP